MRQSRLLLTALVFLTSSASAAYRALPVAAPNANRVASGVLRDGVLRVSLEAKLTMWYPDGDSLPGIPIEAFAETGRDPEAPGPLLRVPEGTELRVSVRNSLPRDSLTFYLPSGPSAPNVGPAIDSVRVPPGESREIRAVIAPGTHLYRAVTSNPLARQLGVGGLLSGAVVVDPAESPRIPRDRVFVIQAAIDSFDAVAGIPFTPRSVFAINGRSWPHTEQLSGTVGDTATWRVVNASVDPHPMHLHGFYFRVDEFAGPLVARDEQGPLPRHAVTERMSAFSTMSITWVPERAGNWLFHCHLQPHVLPHGALSPADPAPGEVSRISPHAARVAQGAHDDHAATGMAGLVLGVAVSPRAGERIAEPAAGRRRLRLLAVQNPGFPDSAPSMIFAIEDPAAPRQAGAVAGSGTLTLARGEPVSITVVNRLPEPTTVHWHGIELESYYDGVAGFAGFRQRLAPMIAPGDSFEARFTPPRAGTFIYHSHADEPRQHRAGLSGPLIVEGPAGVGDAEDVVVMMRSARAGAQSPIVVEINGKASPDTVVLRMGRRYRLRFINMTMGNPSARVWLTARPDSAGFGGPDSLVARWSPVAKDGLDLPDRDRGARAARQIVSIGETFDFEYVPQRPGDLRVEVRASIQRERLLGRLPIRVE